MNATGYLTDVIKDEGFHVFVPFSNTYLLERQQITEVDILMADGRSISSIQRRKIFALISDITDYICAPGGSQRSRAELETLRQMQLLYLMDCLDDMDNVHNKELVRRQLTVYYCTLLDVELFSLSSVDMSTARDFTDWLVEMCVVHGIPCIDTLLNRCEDIGRYLYACVANRRCALCGKPAHIHHLEGSRVGMGRNRKRINHLGAVVLPLCGEQHHIEIHNMSEEEFLARHHLQGLPLDQHLCDLLNMNTDSAKEVG